MIILAHYLAQCTPLSLSLQAFMAHLTTNADQFYFLAFREIVMEPGFRFQWFSTLLLTKCWLLVLGAAAAWGGSCIQKPSVMAFAHI